MDPQKDRESEMHETKYGDRETQTLRQKRYTARDRERQRQKYGLGDKEELETWRETQRIGEREIRGTTLSRS